MHVERKRVAVDDFDVGEPGERLVQGREQAAVEFDADDAPSAPGQLERQHAQAGADLEDGVVRRDVGGRDDRLQGRGVDEEVLSEALVGTKPITLEQLAYLRGRA